MSFLKIKEKVKWILQADRFYFSFINWKYNLKLNFKSNKDQLSIFKEVFYHNAYKLGFPKEIEKAVIVDIGAHYGYFSLSAAKMVGEGSKIFSIEPDENNFKPLGKNTNDSGLKNIFPLNIAIGGNSSDRILYTAASTNNSLYANYLDQMNGHNYKVQCLGLKEFLESQNIKHVDFLKLDCEGSEHEIIQNAEEGTLKKVSVISMEIHDMSHCGFDREKTIATLKNSGFEILYSDFESKKHKKGFNAKVVLKLKNIYKYKGETPLLT
jgi:FkbM family methyltransferase